jgi:hypothetical protein
MILHQNEEKIKASELFAYLTQGWKVFPVWGVSDRKMSMREARLQKPRKTSVGQPCPSRGAGCYR